MKWFKHLSSSRRDPDLYAAREEFGGDGVDIFWSTLELIAEEFKGNDSLTHSKKYFTDNIPGYSWKKILKVWQFFGDNSREKRRIIVEINDDRITLTVPKFKEIADDYTKRLRRVSVQQYEQTTSQEGEVEEEVEKEKDIKDKRPSSNGNEDRLPYKEIIQYLNEATGRHYHYKNDKTRKIIKARFKEGHSLADFMTAIDAKCREWLGNPDMEKYLRPETLFGNKMDKYVNEGRQRDPNFKHVPDQVANPKLVF